MSTLPQFVVVTYDKSTIELLTTGLRFPVSALSSRFLEVFENNFFPQLTDDKALFADDKSPLAHHCRCPAILLTLNSVWLS